MSPHTREIIANTNTAAAETSLITFMPGRISRENSLHIFSIAVLNNSAESTAPMFMTTIHHSGGVI